MISRSVALSPMQKSNYEVEVLVNGHPIKEYYKDGKIYIEGRKGCEYSLRIKNNGWKKIVVIPTIDGVSVMNGKQASYDSPGYIISGYNSLTIDGWRTSDSENTDQLMPQVAPEIKF